MTENAAVAGLYEALISCEGIASLRGIIDVCAVQEAMERAYLIPLDNTRALLAYLGSKIEELEHR